ncbi:MAG: hypothetical protein ACOY82_09285 [Pseudomonadota bacterium]
MARTGREISSVPPQDSICRPCLWSAVVCAALAFLLFATLGGLREGSGIKGTVFVFAIVYAALRYLRDSGEYEGPKTRVVLLDRDLLFRHYGSEEFERLRLRHVHRVSVARAGPRGTVLCIRIDYMRPGEPGRQLEFVPCPKYRFDAEDRNPLCEELSALAAEARGRDGRVGDAARPSTTGL